MNIFPVPSKRLLTQGDGLKVAIHPDIFIRRVVRAFFTTRQAGADHASISGLTGVPQERIFRPIQRHTDRVHVLRFDMKPVVADAVITKRRDVLIGVAVADCVPVLLHDPIRRVCAAVHAGWRGTAREILRKTVDRMRREFYSDPKDIAVAIGPSIRWCCYTVGTDVLHAVRRASGDGEYFMRKGGRICLDLPSANRQQALSAGIGDDNIWMSDECTYCNPHRYYSYRFSRHLAGRQGGFIGMVAA